MNKPEAKMMVSKLDAAKRQLETSIHLYFSYGDPVSVHTLAAAAYNVIHDLNEKRGGEKMLKDMWQLLDTEDAALFRKHINEAENFLKHADRDPDGLLELSPQWTEVLLLDASMRYCVLTDEQPAALQLFINWFVVRHPNVFRESPEIAALLKKIDLRALPEDRREYFKAFLPYVLGLGDA